MRLSSAEAEEMIKAADIDEDGLISYEEFVKLFCGKAWEIQTYSCNM